MLLRKNHYLAFAGVLLSLGGIIAAAAAISGRPKPVTVPEQTPIAVTLDQGLASDKNRPGDHFEAKVSAPIVIDEHTVIPQGARVQGLVVDARPSGRLTGRARLQLSLESIDVAGKSYPLQTTASQKIGGNHKKRNWAWIAGGGGGGLLVGALAGGGKGALIGGLVGAGAGTAVAFVTGKKDIHLSPETPLTFHLAQPVTINVKS
ncbi:MAG TPA: hypothetical protein VIX91_05710 [Candidatus Acidoferrum sp.]